MTEANEIPKSQPWCSDLLKGKRGVVLGVANKRSLAWGIAQVLSNHGARLAFTYQGERIKENVEALMAGLPLKSLLYPCDVTRPEEIANLFEALGREFGELDFLVHGIAFAKKEDLDGRAVDTSPDGFQIALQISTYSFIALTRAAEPLLEKKGGSVLGLTYLGSEKVIPNYNVMGVAKAGLESAVRYLAYDLGRKNIRVNAISAGPVNTLAARGIPRFTEMLENHRKRCALGRNVEAEEVANAALFLLSPLASAVTGEILYVDCGYRIMGI